jgi:hypothetical protein
VARRERQDSTDRSEAPERSDATLAKQPTENADPNEPMLPTDRIDPTDPTDRIDPFDLIDRIEFSEPIDRIDVALRPIGPVCLGLVSGGQIQPPLVRGWSALHHGRGAGSLSRSRVTRTVPPGGTFMNLETALDEIVELARTELHIVGKRAEKTAARDHGHDFHEMQSAADRLDHLAHTLRKRHDQEFGARWRHESASD